MTTYTKEGDKIRELNEYDMEKAQNQLNDFEVELAGIERQLTELDDRKKYIAKNQRELKKALESTQ